MRHQPIVKNVSDFFVVLILSVGVSPTEISSLVRHQPVEKLILVIELDNIPYDTFKFIGE